MEKIKHFIESERGKDILTVVIVILVGIGSFELGRLSKDGGSEGVKIEYLNPGAGQEATVISAFADTQNESSNMSPAGSKTFFASNRGTKYYSMGCSGGKTIKQENRIWFTTGEEAEQAGYELSASCR